MPVISVTTADAMAALGAMPRPRQANNVVPTRRGDTG